MNPHLSRSLFALRGAALSLLCLAAGAVQAQGGTGAGQTLRIQINSDIRSTDPGGNRDDNTDNVLAHVVEGLVALREDTSVGPMLASKVDTSADGLTYTFTLRDGVKFQNGATLAADDVVWSWQRYLKPGSGWRCLSEFDGKGMTKILSVEAPNPKTVVFKLERPTALFLTTMARPDCGSSGVVQRSSVGADGQWKEPVGTGPYKFKDWKRGQYIELTRFDGYSSRSEPRDGFTGGKKAEIENLRFVIIPDSAAAKAALYSGGIDAFVSPSPSDVIEMRGRSDVTVDTTPVMTMVALLMQTQDPVLKDARLRRALALALDTPEIARTVTEGLSKVNNSVVPSTSPFYDATQATGFKRDLPAAKKLLAEAGYRGQPIKLIANKRYEALYSAAVLVQAMASEAGINIELEVLDWATQLDRYTKGQYQSMAFIYSARIDPSLNYEMVTGDKASQPRKVWDSPYAQTRVAESMTSQDKARRQMLFDEMHKQMLQDVPMVVLFNASDATALRKNVLGFKGWAPAKPRFWNVRLDARG
ncbi:peptide/nickel transport system substrate-binding protein [Variovorax sp. OK605]|jgi:peptide/nickel transport system substrate-binding protein|uniref:ABC transporter substrate-binding protein n=1 Tax=Variovorax sp. OK605 TaxID=1855317 RepID=UPI0008EF3F9C|nr:ABC transporter substrate-binding protein [Variovorax sp. OK605]SFQ28451.1 peptide/nickel transport system substrate-binding protein [Variovorax sp. OK605]